MFEWLVGAVIVGAALLLVALQSKARRRYSEALEARGFVSSPAPSREAARAIATARTRPFAAGGTLLDSPCVAAAGSGEVWQGLLEKGSGSDAAEAVVFVVPRPGVGPAEPVLVFPHPYAREPQRGLAGAAAAAIGASALELPAALEAAGILCALAARSGALSDRLEKADMDRLARAPGRGFESIEIGPDGVVLTVATNRLEPEVQIEYAFSWAGSLS